ncbi:hypothetical protein XF_0648 [Xylella fastidiosa 9a5c]|uniref:Uncharacterized protein n=1 Tax=Xylella fastidiosa (strain 9a5c) TaxID=160492 RepID=Q9PFK9_XYLFA|nr:hypothetical protein XF_0648 [Xylella fastidiosa 9a5c]
MGTLCCAWAIQISQLISRLCRIAWHHALLPYQHDAMLLHVAAGDDTCAVIPFLKPHCNVLYFLAIDGQDTIRM